MSLSSARRCLASVVLALVLAPLGTSCSGGKPADPGGSPPADTEKAGTGLWDVDGTRAIKPQPANPETIRRDKAIADYTEAIRQNPNDADSRGVLSIVKRGGVYAEKEEHDKAIADFTEALRLYPTFKAPSFSALPARLIEADEARGRSYQKLGNYDKAIADYTEVIRFGMGGFKDIGEAIAFGGFAAQALYARGVCYAEKQEPILALADFEKAEKAGFSNDDLQRRMKKARAGYTETVYPGKLGPKEREKAYPTKMAVGRTYYIDLTGHGFGTFLRLEDDKGKIVAECDGSGARVAHAVFTPPADGSYRIVAGTLQAITREYEFSLTIRELKAKKKDRSAKPTTPE